jgi:effector-binding domain-containing protein
MSKESDMDYHVELKTVLARATAVVRLQATIPQLPDVIPKACGEVWQFVKTSGIPSPGRNIAVYLDAVMNIECGVEVAQSFTGNGRVECSSTPAGRVATTVHIGPYHQLGKAHDAVQKWCAANGHALTGQSWEVYGHWTDDPTKLRTDVFWLPR